MGFLPACTSHTLARFGETVTGTPPPSLRRHCDGKTVVCGSVVAFLTRLSAERQVQGQPKITGERHSLSKPKLKPKHLDIDQIGTTANQKPNGHRMWFIHAVPLRTCGVAWRSRLSLDDPEECYSRYDTGCLSFYGFDLLVSSTVSLKTHRGPDASLLSCL